MKKSLWLFSILSVAIAFTATAQFNLPQGTQHQYFKTRNGNPLDAIRQRHAQSANRMANTEITIDYATSNGDDVLLANYMNMRFAQSDTFGDRYVVVGFDSLHDQPSNTGYKYSDFDSVRIDSVFFAIGHENNDGVSDSLTVKLVQLSAAGYPTNTVLWSQTFTSGPTSFTGQSDWLQLAAIFVAPQLTIPSATKFGFRVEYSGAKTDTFAYIFSFVDKGACANYGVSYSANLSAFWPNSYRFNVFNYTLLPTSMGQDIYWDCDGNGSGETDNPVQNINFIAVVTGIDAGGNPQPSGCDTLSNIFAVDTPSIYGIQGGSGFISGHNSYGDISKAEEFSNVSNAQVSGAFLLFAVADYANANSTITARVWDSDGAGGSPGTVLASETLNIIDIAADVAIPDFTYVTFDPPAAVTGNYFIGISFAYAAGDTVALVTNQGDSGSPNTAWEQWSDSSWNTYASAWGSEFSHFILSEICTQGSCPTITVATNTTDAICTSVNGTAGAVAAGGVAPYTYAWSNGQTTASLTGLAAGTYTVTATDSNGCTGVATVTVGTTNTVVTVGVTDTDNTSCGAPNGSATASASAGTAPYTYTWSTGGTAATVSNLAAGSYTVTAYDANGCSGTGSASVASAPPTITVSTSSMTPNTQCTNPNGAATVSAIGGTGPYTFQWDVAAGSQTGATASNLAGGTYSVTATDGAGCTGTGNVTVGTTTPTITVSATSTTQNTSCATPDGAATVSATGGTGPYNYQWDAAAGNQTGATASGLGGGTYSVTATDINGCTGSGSITVTSTTPVITVSVAASTGNSSCTNPNGAAIVSATGGTGSYTWAWSSGQSTASVSALANGSYTVTATDGNSCTGTGNVVIADSRPVLSVSIAASPVTSCITNNGSATATTAGTAGTVTYTWSTSPAQSSATAVDLAAGNYTVTALDQTSGCTATASTTIGTNTPAVTVTISSSNNVTNCDTPNGSATATASGGAGGFTYAWSTNPAQTTATATGLAAGSYTVTATSSNGCTASTTASISNNTATITVDITATAVTSCAAPNGSAVAVASGGTAPYSYLWSSGQTSSTLNNLSAGAYSVTVEDANGCEGSDNTTVGTNTVQPSVTTTVTNETSVNANDGSATASGSGGTAPYTYQWNAAAGNQTGATATNLDTGTYTVTLTDANGCTASANAVVGTGVGIALPTDVTLLSIFPNPTTDGVNIQMELKEMNQVKIEWFNVLGEAVIVREFTKVNTVNERFSLGMLPEGVYMARITVGGESVTSRITVAR